MSTFLIILLTVAVFLFVANPLRKQRQVAANASGDSRLDELQARKDTTYAMLKELEFDHESGLLADEDFTDLEDRYKGKAISILKDLDSAERGAGRGADSLDEIEQEVLRLRRVAGPSSGDTHGGPLAEVEDEIERQVRELRRVEGPPAGGSTPASGGRPQTTDEDEIERKVGELRQSKGRFCTQCGRRAVPEDRFCGSCGASLSRGGK